MNAGYTQGTIDALLARKAQRPGEIAHAAELERLRNWGTEARAAREEVTQAAVDGVDSILGALS